MFSLQYKIYNILYLWVEYCFSLFVILLEKEVCILTQMPIFCIKFIYKKSINFKNCFIYILLIREC